MACHTDLDNGGPYLAGGRALNTPFGVFYPPNITPHPVDGIGNWNFADLENALTHGVSPGGDYYYPVFPYTAYSGMEAADIEALFSYLMTVPAVPREDTPHVLSWYIDFRSLNRLWQWFFFTPPPPPANRGEYLVKSLGHCDECHTRRNVFGALDYDRHLSGNRDGIEGDPVPNITPDAKTGIGRWGRSDLIRYLRNGMLPDGDFAGGLMVEVIDEGLSYLTPEDRAAIVDYLRRVTPVMSEDE